MKYGGLFRTPLITDDNGVQHWSCIAWGEVTRNAVEKCGSKNPYCEFALRLKKGVFLNCIIRKRSSVYDVASLHHQARYQVQRSRNGKGFPHLRNQFLRLRSAAKRAV